MTKGNKIKIFISMHEFCYVPQNNLFAPIQVGTALTDERYENMFHDDEGENISKKNKMYCELTAQYWAWKNMPDLDYYGFFHYRRYLSFNPIQMEHYENIVYMDYCNEEAVERLMLKEDIMRNLISEYDIIYPQENPIGGDTIYEHWCKHLEKKDIDTLVQVIVEKYPEFYDLAREVFNSKQAIHCNMFIMKKEYFMQYSEWLFDILKECETRIDFSDYTTEKLRTLGHMAERLCAIYGKYLEKQGAKVCYVQRVQFKNNEPEQVIDIKDTENLIPIILSCNNNYVKYTSVLLESIMRNRNQKDVYHIYILHRDITKENMQILRDQLSKTNNMYVEFVDVKRKMEQYNNLFVDRHLSLETYFRFMAIELFPNLHKILYLDCDVIVEKDVAELFKKDMGNHAIAATRDVDIISLFPEEDTQDLEVRDDIRNVLGLLRAEDYFQAGVLILNLEKIRKIYHSEDIFQTALQRHWKFQDQDVLNYLFKNDVYYLELNWNTLFECFDRAERVEKFVKYDLAKEYKEAKRDPWIIHYAGTPKPWDNMQTDMGYYFWKYAQSSPFFEILIHEMNIKGFNALKAEREERAFNNGEKQELIRQRDELQNHLNESSREKQELQNHLNESNRERQELTFQRDELQNHLNEIRKSFSYKLGLWMTAIPRKIRGKKEN